MLKNKIIAAIGFFFGSLWFIGGLVYAADGVITGITYGMPEHTIGSGIGAGILVVIGFFVLKFSYKKWKAE